MKTIQTKADLAWLMSQADTTQGVLMVARPGSGAFAVARRMAARVPAPDGYDAVEVAWLHYGAGLGGDPYGQAPLRAPHHTCSAVALHGGGPPSGRVRPGECSLAHRGTLLLDDAEEFGSTPLQAVAECCGRGQAVVGGGGEIRATLPSNPRLLIAICKPCPCGYYGTDRCTCGKAAVQRHQARVAKVADVLGLAVHVRVKLPQTK